MAETKTLITADQLFHMSFPDERVELSEGELIRMTAAGFEHGVIAGKILACLSEFVTARDLGVVATSETGYKLDEYTLRDPDVSFVAKARVEGLANAERFFPGAPDLAVEVVSPGDSASDLQKKIKEYFQAGAQRVWVVYPRLKQVHVYRNAREVRVLEASDSLSGEDLLPGFSLAVQNIFL